MKPFGLDQQGEENLDLLQNTEFAIVEAYRAMPGITDYDVNDALEALTRHYVAEEAGRAPSAIALDTRAQAVYDNVRRICEWRMGRAPAASSPARAQKGLADVIYALRTIMKSIKRWSGRGGKRGYLDFVKNYLP
jgi:hypothetical protein